MILPITFIYETVLFIRTAGIRNRQIEEQLEGVNQRYKAKTNTY